MKQGILTIVAPITEGGEGVLRNGLKASGPSGIPFHVLGDLHFASLSIIEDEGLEPHLVFEVSFDGTREDFIDELVTLIPDEIDRVFQFCKDYPESGTRLPQLVKNYLETHDAGADALYIGFPGRTVGQIREETSLRNELVAEIDRIRAATPPPADQSTKRSLFNDLRKHVRGIRHFADLLTSPEQPFLVKHGAGMAAFATAVIKILALVGFFVWLSGAHGWNWFTSGLFAISYAVFIAVVVVVAIVLLWVVIVQLKESFDTPDPSEPSWDSAREETLRRLENLTTQNHLIGLNRLKPGFIRLWTLRLVLWLIDLGAMIVENRGSLGGVSTIHFARWVIIGDRDQGRWLMFVSHYDGDWGGYLSDFVTLVPGGMTAIWSNCAGFPRAWFLVFGGVKDERTFKAYARRSQHETLYRYSAYPHLSVGDIDNHTIIRTAIGQSLDPVGVDALMRRL